MTHLRDSCVNFRPAGAQSTPSDLASLSRVAPLAGRWPWSPAARWCLVGASIVSARNPSRSRGRWRGHLSRWRC
jgi:hypothetical protein